MSRLERLVAELRPGIELRSLAVHDDEAVLAGGNEVFRLPLAPAGAERLAVLVRAMPVLKTRLPVPMAVPRRIGVMPDGETPFTGSPLLPGSPAQQLDSIALLQLAGMLAALANVPAREARQWGVQGDGPVLLHGALRQACLLVDPDRGVLTGVTGWRLRLGEAGEDLAGLPESVRAALD